MKIDQSQLKKKRKEKSSYKIEEFLFGFLHNMELVFSNCYMTLIGYNDSKSCLKQLVRK